MIMKFFQYSWLLAVCFLTSILAIDIPDQDPLVHQAVRPSATSTSTTTTATSIPSSNHTIRLRPANASDVSAITDIIVDAFAPARHWNYVFQFRKQNPEYHWECLHREIESAFLPRNEKKFDINVIDDFVDDGNGGLVEKAVSVGIWEVRGEEDDEAEGDEVWPYVSFPRWPGTTSRERRRHAVPANAMRKQNFNCSAHLDVNLTRALHCNAELDAYQRKYLDDVYPWQMYLNLLATHPDFDGRGYGAAQVEWGKSRERLDDAGRNITLIATPAGYELYKTIEFEKLKNLTLTTVGQEMLSWFEVMAWDPRLHE